MTQTVHDTADLKQIPTQERLMKPAMWRGLKRKCPNCGEGAMFDGYLTVRDTCTVCGQELHHHRADDGPAYLTILVVGHIMAPLIHVIFAHLRPEPLVMATGFTLATVALALYLLPRLKGLVVAIQWSKFMYGFKQDT